MKKSLYDKALEQIDKEIAVLLDVKARLAATQQQTKAPARRTRPRAVPAKDEKQSA